MQRLGEPGTKLADWLEEPVFMLETAPRSNLFMLVPWAGKRFRVTEGLNCVPTAEFEVSLGDTPRPTSGSTDLVDWLVRDFGGRTTKADEILLDGRRIWIRTDSGQGWDDYLMFEGFVDKVELGFSGVGKDQRSVVGHAISTAIAADRERNQQHWGQWRRTRAAELKRVYGRGKTDPNQCCRVPVPLVFNPGGRPNCNGYPLNFADGSKVYIPCDPDDDCAKWWTVAKALWYIAWSALQPARPVDWQIPRSYDIFYNSSLKGMEELRYTWTTFRILHWNLYELVSAPALGGKTILESNPDNGTGSLGLQTWLRAPADMAVEGMSTLEAFTYLCERAGAAWSASHVMFNNGMSGTKITFSARGHIVPLEEVPLP